MKIVVEMDITEPLDILDSESFTCIIDKGTLDCVACSSENQGGSFSKQTKQMLDNLHRILAPGGSYICVSHGRPETRLPYLTPVVGSAPGYKWTVEVQKVPKRIAQSSSGIDLLERIDQETFYYVYIATKKY
jgi:EEF1A lysine methyltransferase 4